MHNLAAVSSRPSPVACRDLTDPAQGHHAIQLMLRRATESLAGFTRCHPLVDRTAAAFPSAVLARALHARRNALVVRPRAVTGADARFLRHELQVWWVRRGDRLGLRDLGRCLWDLAAATVPGLVVSAVPADAVHAIEGRQLDLRVRGAWHTVATCGVVDPALLRRAGLREDASGLVLTIDLDRLVLLAKGLDDRALLRDGDPAVAIQMLDLDPYVPPALTALHLRIVDGSVGRPDRLSSAR